LPSICLRLPRLSRSKTNPLHEFAPLECITTPYYLKKKPVEIRRPLVIRQGADWFYLIISINMARTSKQLTEQEIASIQINPPYLLNTFQAAAFLGKSVRTVREMFHEDGFPIKRGSSPNSEMYVLRDDLLTYMDGNGSLVK
jgi:hypothetical protein